MKHQKTVKIFLKTQELNFESPQKAYLIFSVPCGTFRRRLYNKKVSHLKVSSPYNVLTSFRFSFKHISSFLFQSMAFDTTNVFTKAFDHDELKWKSVFKVSVKNRWSMLITIWTGVISPCLNIIEAAERHFLKALSATRNIRAPIEELCSLLGLLSLNCGMYHSNRYSAFPTTHWSKMPYRKLKIRSFPEANNIGWVRLSISWIIL